MDGISSFTPLPSTTNTGAIRSFTFRWFSATMPLIAEFALSLRPLEKGNTVLFIRLKKLGCLAVFVCTLLLSSIKSHYKNRDRKSTRLNSSHVAISYAVFCLKKKRKQEV